MTHHFDWPNAPQSTDQIRSFDGAVSQKIYLQKPDRYAFFRGGATRKSVIARGAGLSYAAASFGGDAVSIDMCSFNRLLAVCNESRLVEVEAGISLGELYSFLLGRGLYLPVQPGHGRITVGGCIAANVHGKNQNRDGTFVRQVDSIKLYHPDRGLVHLSREDRGEVFHATCGGYGTTGIIVSARLRCADIPGNAVRLTTLRIGRVEEVVKALQSVGDSDFAYTWHDFTRFGSDFGRGYVVAGNFVSVESSLLDTLRMPATSKLRALWPLPAFNGSTTRAANTVHHALRTKHPKAVSLHESLFPIHGSEYYFSAFGRRGFHEFQALVPHEHVNEYLIGLKEAILKHGTTITLASAKSFSGTTRLIRFDGDGLCFAINFPRTRNSLRFLASLDALLLRVGGLPNIVKDSRLPREVVEASYPELPQLRETLRDWDKNRRFRSELSDRIGL